MNEQIMEAYIKRKHTVGLYMYESHPLVVEMHLFTSDLQAQKIWVGKIVMLLHCSICPI